MTKKVYTSIETTEYGQQPLMFGPIAYAFDFYFVGILTHKTPGFQDAGLLSFVLGARQQNTAEVHAPLLKELQRGLDSFKHLEAARQQFRGTYLAPANLVYRALHQARYAKKSGLIDMVNQLRDTKKTSMICTSSILVEYAGNPRGGYRALSERYKQFVDGLLAKEQMTPDSALLIHFAFIDKQGKISSSLDKKYVLEKMPRVALSSQSQTWIKTLNKTTEQGKENPNGKAEVDTLLSYLTGFPIDVLPNISEVNGFSNGMCNVLEEGSSSVKNVLLAIPREEKEFPTIVLSSADFHPPAGILIKPHISGVRARDSLWSRGDKGMKRPRLK